MKLQELPITQKLTIQIVWGERKISFVSEVIEKDLNGIYVSPYIHQGSPLELTIDAGKGVVCNVYTENPLSHRRISWKSVALSTRKKGDKVDYYLRTSNFNHMAKEEERRAHERILIRKNAQLYDVENDVYTDICVHDISDNGIAFYAPLDFKLVGKQFTIILNDYAANRYFDMILVCSVARTQKNVGRMLYGCKIVEENEKYLLYGCLKKMDKRNGKLDDK